MPTRSIQHNLQAERVEAERVQSVSGGFSSVVGSAFLAGEGEGKFDVNFPVSFTNKPYFFFGHEVEQGAAISATAFPVCSASVLSWDTSVNGDGSPLYNGAVIAVVTLGVAESHVHFKFEGVALKNPISPSPKPEAKI